MTRQRRNPFSDLVDENLPEDADGASSQPPLPENDDFAPRGSTGTRGMGAAIIHVLTEALRWWALLWAELFAAARHRRAVRPKPWHVRVRSRRVHRGEIGGDASLLLDRHRQLKDMEALATVAAGFGLPESDFFADPAAVERLIGRILEENPPWLYVSRKLSGGEQGAESHSQEVVWRDQVTTSVEDVTLFVPDESWQERPLSSLTLRPTKTLDEVWHARLLDQVLPGEILLDRHTRGEIMVPIRRQAGRILEFRTEERRMRIDALKPVPIPIDTQGGSGRGGQLLYVLLDFSASMQGLGAIAGLAAIAAALRANMGQRDTRYLFRRFADASELWPRLVEPPLEAGTVPDKDALLATILATSFNGGATHVNDALDAAARDIENLRRDERLDAELMLVTDGRAEIMESTTVRLRAARVLVHTVMVSREKNPGLEAISESFARLDIHPDTEASGPDVIISSPAPRRVFRI